MTGVTRVVCTILVLLFVWFFKGTRLAVLCALMAGVWIRRVWVLQPARVGTLGRRGPPRWLRVATTRAGVGKALRAHTGPVFDRRKSPHLERWW